MKSIYKKTNLLVKLPNFEEDRLLYMHKATIRGPYNLPPQFAHYMDSIYKILSCVRGNSPCYITIDEKIVRNETHRKPGIHVDFNWHENLKIHPGVPPHHSRTTKDETHGGMLLISNYSGCRVFRGDFEGHVGDKGECDLINISYLEREVMEPNRVYFLNALCIHEPLVIKGTVKRILIRINFHPNTYTKNILHDNRKIIKTASLVSL